jgi:DNA repair exonuclease SbcCD nuclease subunit
MEYIGIGDLHYDKMDGLVENANDKISASIRKVFKYAVENGVRHVIFYGDLCERYRMSYEAQVSFYQIALDPKYEDLVIHAILGNHDFAETGAHSLEVLKVLANLMDKRLRVYTEQKLVKLDGKKFNMMPHPVLETRRDCLNIGHFEMKNSFRDNGRQIGHGFTTAHKCCVGHLHTNHRVRRAHYSGTLYQTNFGESLPKFFHHVRYEDDDPYSVGVESVPFDPPWKLINLQVKSESDLKAIEDDENVLYKLFVHEGLDLDIGDVMAEHPNVVRHNRFANKKELQELIQNEWDFESDSFDNNFDTKDVVGDYLREKARLKPKEVKRAFSMLDRIVQKQPATTQE